MATESILEIPAQSPMKTAPSHSEPVLLPSRGMFYHPTNSLCGVEQIEVRYPTIKEQDILINKTFINKGVAIDRLVESVIGNPAINMHKMLTGDKNAIAYQTRINMHGPIYRPRFICPFCYEKIKNVEINLNESKKIKHPPTMEELQEKGIELKDLEGYYSFIYTSQFGNKIEFGLATGEVIEKIKKMVEAQKKNKQTETNRTNELRSLLISINDTKGIMLYEQINKLTSKEVTEFLEIYEFVEPNISLTYEFVCPECGFEDSVPVTIDVDFFWYRP
jgi:hypothetical protein